MLPWQQHLTRRLRNTCSLYLICIPAALMMDYALSRSLGAYIRDEFSRSMSVPEVVDALNEEEEFKA
jgi:hypothetical protein